MLAIQTNNLTKYYGKSRGILDVDLQVEEGEVFGFIGPNGAGKSTTIRTLLNFIFPTSGQAQILGMDCVRNTQDIKRLVGYVPGEVNFYEGMRVKELLTYSADFYSGDFRHRMSDLIDHFELDVEKKVEDLSSGNKKKVAIAIALLHNPRLLILDEPTNGLDPLMQKRFFERLKMENQNGTTIFLSSHILSEVERISHRVGIIKEGQILKIESLDHLRSRTYKKIRMLMNGDNENADSAALIELPGVSGYKRDNQMIQYLYHGPVDALLHRLAAMHIENIWLEEPSLEEIFMHFYEKGGL